MSDNAQAAAQAQTGPDPTTTADPAAEVAQALGQQARASAQAALGAGKALGQLLAADLALAGTAGLHLLLWAGAALVLAGSAWLLLMAAAVAALQTAGLPWWLALLLAALLSLAGVALAGWQAKPLLQHLRLTATRRQLARLGQAAAATDKGSACD